MNKQIKEPIINEELAINELKEFLSNFVDGDINVKEDYPKVLNALMFGNLSFNDKLEPTYQLLESINQDTEFEKKSITFKTRIKPTDSARLAKGIDLKNDAGSYSLVVISHICNLGSIYELDKFSKKDYQVIQELAPVFM